MLVRLVSGIVFVAVFLGCCFLGLLPFALGVTALAALGLGELVTAYRRSAVQNAAARKAVAPPAPHALNLGLAVLGVFCPLVTYVGIAAEPTLWIPPWLQMGEAGLLAILVGVCMVALLRAARTGEALGKLRRWYGLFGLAYVGMLFSSFVLLRGVSGQVAVAPFGVMDRGAWLMFFVAFCVWATDTFAYLVGRSLGRRKLAPTLSPGKTVEGSLGGLLGAMLAGAVFAHWIHLSFPHGLVVGAIAGTVGQMGDLFESALKREIGLKDFGNLLPGHGGILDRFDSLLFVTPLAYLYLRFLAGLH
jgi:phosphatidate cytidylyltransferase